MRFGEKIRDLRKSQDLTQLTQGELGDLVGVTFAYISKVKNERLDFGDYPSEDLICTLAIALKADEDDLMLLAKKIPGHICQRVLECPEAFRKFADLSDEDVDRLLVQKCSKGGKLDCVLDSLWLDATVDDSGNRR